MTNLYETRYEEISILFAVEGGVPDGSELFKFTHPDTQQESFVRFGTVAWKSVDNEEVPADAVYAVRVDD